MEPRKLKVEWTKTMAEDLRTMQGIDAVQAIEAALIASMQKNGVEEWLYAVQREIHRPRSIGPEGPVENRDYEAEKDIASTYWSWDEETQKTSISSIKATYGEGVSNRLLKVFDELKDIVRGESFGKRSGIL